MLSAKTVCAFEHLVRPLGKTAGKLIDSEAAGEMKLEPGGSGDLFQFTFAMKDNNEAIAHARTPTPD